MSETRWFTTSLADAQAMRHPMMGFGYLFGEDRPGDRFDDFGINVRVVDPGQPTAMYHSRPRVRVRARPAALAALIALADRG